MSMAAVSQVGPASGPSAIFAAGFASSGFSSAQTVPSTGDTYTAQYSPQIYAVVSTGLGSENPIQTANVFNPNTVLPPLQGSGALRIPGAPPTWSFPPLLIR